MSLSNDEMVAEHIRCQDSFPYFLRYVEIEDANKGVIPLELWPYLVQIASDWETGDSWIEGKARQLGYSWLLASYDNWLLRYRKNARILSISIGERESKELLEKVKFVDDHLPSWMRMQRNKDSVTEFGFLKTGSSIIALPSTESAGRGEQATLVQTDEWAFHKFAGKNYASYRSAIADGGQHIAVTTGNGPTGMFFDFWNSSDPDLPYQTRFNGWRSRPDRADKWYERERKAYLAADKHHMLFARENPETVEEMFTAFVGLVYDVFSAQRHAVADPFTYESCKWRVAGVDPGQGDPAAISIIGESEDGKAHQFPEFYQQGVTTIDDLETILRKWNDKAPLHGIAIDGTEGTLIASLQAKGLPAFAANRERGIGIGHVAARLSSGNFTINAGNSHTIREFHSYRWAERRAPGEADPYTTSTPVDHHGDLLDTIRYALVFLSQYCSSTKTAEVTGPDYGDVPEKPSEPKPDAKNEWRDPLSIQHKEHGTLPRPQGRIGPNYRTRKSQPVMGRR